MGIKITKLTVVLLPKLKFSGKTELGIFATLIFLDYYIVLGAYQPFGIFYMSLFLRKYILNCII